MKAHKKIFFTLLAFVILIMGAISKKSFFVTEDKVKLTTNFEKKITKNIFDLQVISKNQENSITNSTCEKVRKTYSDLNSLMKNQFNQLRFENIHKKIGPNIYRLRHFFKEGDESEIETFLVYLEDHEENARIVEKSTYKKGQLFLKIEKTEGEIIYHEEGLNHGEDLFLHYINNQLREAQGQSDNNPDFKDLDCHFQHA